jgi:hypothetical protein
MSSGAAGPWVVVVGMHRSGTSAVTGAIGALGFNSVSAGDRMSPHDSNPEHWESLSIALHNDEILAYFGGTWDAPPDLSEGWERDGGVPDRSAASKLLTVAYPNPGPSVWKDPRLCLVLPYWRDLLRTPMVAVLVWRAPVAVARSLQRRDGMPLPYGIALWERYNRSAIANLARSKTYVLDYDDMVGDPAASLSGLSSWMRNVGAFDGTSQQHHERALSIVTTDLRHESATTTAVDDGILLSEQSRLVAQLTDLAGAHDALPQLPGDESPWTRAILGVRRSSNLLELRKSKRQLEHTEAERDWFASTLAETRSDLDDAQGQLASLRGSSSWRLTAPIRSVSTRWAASRDRRAKT